MKYIIVVLGLLAVIPVLGQLNNTELTNPIFFKKAFEKEGVELTEQEVYGRCWKPNEYYYKDSIYLKNVLLLKDNLHLLKELKAYEIYYPRIPILPERDTVWVERVAETMSFSVECKWKPIIPKPEEEIRKKYANAYGYYDTFESRIFTDSIEEYYNRPVFWKHLKVGDTITELVGAVVVNSTWRSITIPSHTISAPVEHCVLWAYQLPTLIELPVKMVVKKKKGELWAVTIPETHTIDTNQILKIHTIKLPAFKKEMPYIMPKFPLTNSLRKKAVFSDVVVKVMTESTEWTGWRQVLVRRGNSSYSVRQIQMALNRFGYRVPVDDILGDKTKNALREFQKEHNLPQGRLDLETLKALKIIY